MRRALLLLFLVAISVLYLGRAFAGVFDEKLLSVIASISKLGAFAVGAVFAARVARGQEGRARTAWMLVAVWLAFFFAGQSVLSTYQLILSRPNPVPSLGDPLFVVGYVAMVLASVQFVRMYRATGLPIGTGKEHALVGGAAAIALGVIAFVLLLPIARSDRPLAERAINVAYPVLDLIAMVPALVILRITLRFLGGRAGWTWGAIVMGFVLAAAGDLLFAYFTSHAKADLEPLVDWVFILSYTSLSSGAVLQHRMMR
jgi:hypothetical protein